MPIPLGVLAVAGAGAAPSGPGVYELIETINVGTATSSVSFSNLNSTYGTTYQHLQLRATYRTSSVVGFNDMRLRFNSDSGTNYAFYALSTRESGLTSPEGTAFTGQTYARMGWAAGDNNNSNVFTGSVVDIVDAFETTKNKNIRALTGFMGAANVLETMIGLLSANWNNTAAITTITLSPSSGNFPIGSRFSLYGIRSVNP
jgi:hypothetical protein